MRNVQVTFDPNQQVVVVRTGNMTNIFHKVSGFDPTDADSVKQVFQQIIPAVMKAMNHKVSNAHTDM